MIAIVGALYLVNARDSQSAKEAPNATSATYGPFIHPPYVAILGDSYTFGSLMDNGADSLWPSLLAPLLHIAERSFALGGTGFVSGSATGADFARRVPALIVSKPDIVVIEGGHNDSASNRSEVAAAASKVVADIQAGLPNAKLVIVGPIWPTGDAAELMKQIDADLKELSGKCGATFVDPIADGWFSGQYVTLIGSDGTHPTAAGHQHIADLMEQVLAPLVEQVHSK